MRNSIKNGFYHLFSQLFRREIIRDSFIGILGRYPDDQSLKEYERSFKGLGPGGVIRDIVSSQEHWEKVQSDHATDIITAIYRGILERDPEEDALMSYKERFGSLRTEGLIANIAGSEEHWEKIEIKKAAEGKMSKWIEVLID